MFPFIRSFSWNTQLNCWVRSVSNYGDWNRGVPSQLPSYSCFIAQSFVSGRDTWDKGVQGIITVG